MIDAIFNFKQLLKHTSHKTDTFQSNRKLKREFRSLHNYHSGLRLSLCGPGDVISTNLIILITPKFSPPRDSGHSIFKNHVITIVKNTEKLASSIPIPNIDQQELIAAYNAVIRLSDWVEA